MLLHEAVRLPPDLLVLADGLENPFIAELVVPEELLPELARSDGLLQGLAEESHEELHVLIHLEEVHHELVAAD